MSDLRITSEDDSPATPEPMPTSFDLGAWLPRMGVAMFFILVVGIDKLSTNPYGPWVKTFDAIGVGQWLRYVTGVLQITGGLLYVFPRTMAVGTFLLSGTMAGAVVAQIVFLHSPGSALIPGSLLVLILLVWRRTTAARRLVSTS